MSPISPDKESVQVDKDKIETASKQITEELVEDKRVAEQNKARQTSKSKKQEKKSKEPPVESRSKEEKAESSKKKIVDSKHFLCLGGTGSPSQRPTSKGIKEGEVCNTLKMPHVEKTKITEELLEIEYSKNLKETEQLRKRHKPGSDKERRKSKNHEEETGKNRNTEDRQVSDGLLRMEYAEGFKEKKNQDFCYDPAKKERPKVRPKSKGLREIEKQKKSKNIPEYVQEIGDSQFTKELVETENPELLKETEAPWQKPNTMDNDDSTIFAHTKEHLGEKLNIQDPHKTTNLAKNFRDTVQPSKKVEDFCKIHAPLPLGSKHFMVPMSRLKDTGYIQVDKKGTFKKQLAANYLEESFRGEGKNEYVTPTQAIWMDMKRQQREQRRIQIDKRRKRNKKREEMLGGQRRSRRHQRLSISDDDTQSDDEFDRPTPQLSKRSKSEDTQSEDEVFVNPLPPLPKRKLKKGYCWDVVPFDKESITFHKKRGLSSEINISTEEKLTNKGKIFTEELNEYEHFDKFTKTRQSKEPNISRERKGGMYEVLIQKKKQNAMNQLLEKKDITSLILEREMLISDEFSQKKVMDTKQIVPECVTDDGKGGTRMCHEIVIEQAVDSTEQYPDSITKTTERVTMMDQEKSYNHDTHSREGSTQSIEDENIRTKEKGMNCYPNVVAKTNIDASQKELYSGNETSSESGPMEDNLNKNICTEPIHLPDNDIQEREQNTEHENIRENHVDFDQGPSDNITKSANENTPCENNLLLVKEGEKSLEEETNIIQENIFNANMTRLSNKSTISGPSEEEEEEVLTDSSSIWGQVLEDAESSFGVKETLPRQSVESPELRPSTSKQAQPGSFEETMGIIEESSVELQKKKMKRHKKSIKNKEEETATPAIHNEADDLQFCALVSYW